MTATLKFLHEGGEKNLHRKSSRFGQRKTPAAIYWPTSLSFCTTNGSAVQRSNLRRHHINYFSRVLNFSHLHQHNQIRDKSAPLNSQKYQALAQIALDIFLQLEFILVSLWSLEITLKSIVGSVNWIEYPAEGFKLLSCLQNGKLTTY